LPQKTSPGADTAARSGCHWAPTWWADRYSRRMLSFIRSSMRSNVSPATLSDSPLAHKSAATSCLFSFHPLFAVSRCLPDPGKGVPFVCGADGTATSSPRPDKVRSQRRHACGENTAPIVAHEIDRLRQALQLRN
jgi:hypothetical protein